MYEFHTQQEGTETHPGQTFDLDYSLVRNLTFLKPALRLQVGSPGTRRDRRLRIWAPPYTRPAADRYAINSIGVASQVTFPAPRLTLGMKFFEEFADRSTFQGYSLQFTGVVNFSPSGSPLRAKPRGPGPGMPKRNPCNPNDRIGPDGT